MVNVVLSLLGVAVVDVEFVDVELLPIVEFDDDVAFFDEDD